MLAVLAGSISNGIRIGDLITGASRHLDDMRDGVRAELLEETAGIRNLIERNQDALLTDLARIDQRVTRIEDRIHTSVAPLGVSKAWWAACPVLLER